MHERQIQPSIEQKVSSAGERQNPQDVSVYEIASILLLKAGERVGEGIARTIEGPYIALTGMNRHGERVPQRTRDIEVFKCVAKVLYTLVP